MRGLGYIAPEADRVCEMCGTITECRPYGPNHEQICFDCAMSTPEMKAMAEKRMGEYIFGEKPILN